MDVCWWYISSLGLSLSLCYAPKKIDTLNRSIHTTTGRMQFAICMYGSPPSLSFSLVLSLHSLDLCDWNRSIFWSENIYTWEERWRTHTCFLLAYVSVMMIIYQETSVVGSLFSLSLSFLVRVSVIRLHQTLFFSRIVINSFTEGER